MIFKQALKSYLVFMPILQKKFPTVQSAPPLGFPLAIGTVC